MNTSVQEGGAPKQHTQHGVEGGAPHRAEAFVAMKRSEERCQTVTTHHAKHDNRAVANTTRYPEGGTSRALTGPEGTRGLTKGAGRAGGERSTGRAGHAGPTPNTNNKAEQSNQGKPTADNKHTAKGTRDNTNRDKTKRRGPHDAGHKRTTSAGRSEQAVHCRPQHITQRKQQTRSTQESKRPKGRSSDRRPDETRKTKTN